MPRLMLVKVCFDFFSPRVFKQAWNLPKARRKTTRRNPSSSWWLLIRLIRWSGTCRRGLASCLGCIRGSLNRFRLRLVGFQVRIRCSHDAIHVGRVLLVVLRPRRVSFHFRSAKDVGMSATRWLQNSAGTFLVRKANAVLGGTHFAKNVNFLFFNNERPNRTMRSPNNN